MAEPSLVVARDLLDRARNRADEYGERVSKLGNTISTWMIVGNAAALAFVSKAIADGNQCSGLLLTSALAFAIGLLLNFAGLIVGHFTSLKLALDLAAMTEQTEAIWINEVYISELERDGIEVPADAPLKQTIDQCGDRMGQIFRQAKIGGLIGVSFAISFTLAGSTSFAWGLLRPLTSPAMITGCRIASSSNTVGEPLGLPNTKSGRPAIAIPNADKAQFDRPSKPTQLPYSKANS